VNGDDLKRLQDDFLAGSKKILLETGHMRPVGFVVTLRKHVDRLIESGWGLEFIDPKIARVRDAQDDEIAALIVDLSMNWRKLYHAVLTVFPQTRSTLPNLLAIGIAANVDDPYMRLMRPFMSATQLEDKDVMAATMRQICDKVDAFASIFNSEAWTRVVKTREAIDEVYKNAAGSLGNDKESVEVVISSMETYDFTRMITVPILRKPSKKARDAGKITGFGELTEGIARPDNNNVIEGRLARFLKPLAVAS
jgi:hypothetical protein